MPEKKGSMLSDLIRTCVEGCLLGALGSGLIFIVGAWRGDEAKGGDQ